MAIYYNRVKARMLKSHFWVSKVMSLLLLVCVLVSSGACDTESVRPVEDGRDPDPSVGDTSLVAATVFFDSYSRIYVAPFNKPTGGRFITPAGESYEFPRFSPTKDRLLMVGPAGQIFLYVFTDGDLQQLTTNLGQSVVSLYVVNDNFVWDPSGGALFYTRDAGFSTYQLDRHDLQTGATTERFGSGVLYPTVRGVLEGPDLFLVSGNAIPWTYTWPDGPLEAWPAGSRGGVAMGEVATMRGRAAWSPSRQRVVLGGSQQLDNGRFAHPILISSKTDSAWSALTDGIYLDSNPVWAAQGILMFDRRVQGAEQRESLILFLDTKDPNAVPQQWGYRSQFEGSVGLGEPEY